jgi:hypothetical protein
MAQFWHAFFEDTRTQIVLLLVVLDLLLGIGVSLKNKDFRLSYVVDFARNDLLGKLLPFAVIYAGYKYAASADIIIPGVDLEVIMNAMWVLVLAALVGSLLASLKHFGFTMLPDFVAGPDPATPQTEPPPT